MITFFDTETTGLPKNWNAPITKLDNWPRIIQLAWMVTDLTGEIITSEKHLIKPDGWVVPVEKFWIDNGYSTEQCEEHGVPLADVLDLFLNALCGCTTVVSHNMDYDLKVTGAEMIRYQYSFLTPKIKMCTKEIGTDVCKIPGNYGKYKWPKLTELHQFLFNKGFDDAHDALADVTACKNCFFEMAKRGIIKL